MIRISLKNIHHLMKNRIFIILIISQLMAVMVIYFVYGIFCSYNASKQEMTIDSYTISAYFEENSEPKMLELKKCFDSVLESTQKRLDYFFVYGSYNDSMWSVHNEYYQGTFRHSKIIKDNMYIKQGRFMTDEEINKGEKIIVGENIGNLGSEYLVGNDLYKIVGISKKPYDNVEKTIEVSYLAYPDEAQISGIILNFKELPRQSDYLAFKSTLEGNFGDKVIVDEFAVRDVEQIMSFNSIILFSILIGTVMALDTGLLYGYIINRRRKQMAVFGLTGAKRIQLFVINETEIIIVSFATMLIGFAFFRVVFERMTKRMFEITTQVYKISIYTKLSLAYMICMIVITSLITFIYSDSNIMNMLRRKDK